MTYLMTAVGGMGFVVVVFVLSQYGTKSSIALRY